MKAWCSAASCAAVTFLFGYFVRFRHLFPTFVIQVQGDLYNGSHCRVSSENHSPWGVGNAKII